MAGGGGGFKKVAINFVLDHPVQAYLGGGALCFAYRQYQIRSTYNYYFGKFEFERKLERGELQHH